MIIYKVTNLKNNKVYIGQSINSLEHRKSGHYRDSKCSKKKSVYFHNALLKYDESDFKWEIIEEVSSKEELDNREQFWIKYYESNNPEKGYNLKAGGQLGGGANSESTKSKIGENTKRKWKDPIIAQKMLSGLRKGTETCKQKAKNNYKLSICKVCEKEFTYRPMDFSHIPKYCSNECKFIDQKKNAINASNKAKEKLINTLKASDNELKEKVINWFKSTKLLTNISYNKLTDIFKELSNITGLKDSRSIMRPFGYTSRKEFVKELSKIYADQV